MRTAILGAGVSGLTAARALGEIPGEDYQVFEAASKPGGLCRVQEREGFQFDLVSHVLHFRSDRAWRLVQDVLGKNLLSVERSAWIFFQDRYIPYPFQSHLGFLPWPQKLACLTGYLRAWTHRLVNGKLLPLNFDEWIRYHFGEGIARHFMVPYNEELWGLPPSEMSTDWVRPFVPNSSLKETLKGLFMNRSARAGYNSCFSYPKRGGMQALVDGLSASIPDIQLKRKAIEFDLDKKTVKFEDGGTATYDHLISTIPLDFLIRHALGVPESLKAAASGLRCSRLLNVTCCLRRPLPHAFHWVYFPEGRFPFFRLVFPSNISPSLAPDGCAIICAEISNPKPDALPELEETVKEGLLALGLITNPSDIAFTVRNYLPHAYPVHDLKRERVVSSLLGFLKSRDIYSIGRFGSWRYSSIDDAIVEALDAVSHMTKRPAPVGA